MAKTKTILVSEAAYQAIVRAANRAGKSISSTASELILGAKSDADLEQMSIRNKIAEMEDKMTKLATRKDIAAVLYTFCRIGEKGMKKERAGLGYRMQLGHDVNVDFTNVSYGEND